MCNGVICRQAIAANCAAVREWDSNGTVFGYNKKFEGHTAGEFGHNDYYPVVMAAAAIKAIGWMFSIFVHTIDA